MNTDCLGDGKKIADEVMNHILIIACRAIMEMNLRHKLIDKYYHVNRSCIYRLIKKYDDGKYEALQSLMAPGADPLIAPEMDE